MVSKVDTVITFGKYKGLWVSEVYERNPHYLKWMWENYTSLTPDLEKALKYHLE